MKEKGAMPEDKQEASDERLDTKEGEKICFNE